jgi:putative colanic acid biosynthesis acetyltransferase WcaF
MKAVETLGYKMIFVYFTYSILQLFFPLMFISPLRVFYLKIFGAKIGKNTIVERIRFFNLHHKGFKGLNIGENCYIGDGVSFDLYEAIILENNVTIAVDSLLLTHTNVGYDHHPLQKYIPKIAKSIRIKNGSFIGSRSIIFPGIEFGPFSASSAGSLINKNVSSYLLVGGVPAKKIKKYAK